MKYLLLLGLIAAIWWHWSKRKAAAEGRPASRPSPVPEKMVNCAHCGVYLPESEGIADGGLTYCSEAHRALGPATGR